MRQVIIGGYVDALNRTAIEFNNIEGGEAWNGNPDNAYQTCPTEGTFSNLLVTLSGVPGTNPYLITLFVNGIPSALVATIAAAATTGIDNTHLIHVSAGDRICLRSSYPAAPDNTPTARWSIQFEGDIANESIILGNLTDEVSSNAFHPCAGGGGGSSVTEGYNNQIVGTNGTLKKLYIHLSAAPGGGPGHGYDMTLRVNGADSNDGAGNPLSIFMENAMVSGNDIVHEIPVVAGDRICMNLTEIDPLNASIVHLGMVFVPDIIGEFLLLGETLDPPANNQTEYVYLTSTLITNAWNIAERFHGGQTPMQLRKFYIAAQNAPGVGNKWTFTVRGGGGSTNITTEISGAATTANDLVHTYDCVDYDALALMCVPDSLPTAGYFVWGLIGYIPPASPAAFGNLAGQLVSEKLI